MNINKIIKEIVERVEISTPGRYTDDGYRIHYPNDDLCFEYKHNEEFHEKDASLFCNAREDLVILLEEVKRLRKLVGEEDIPEAENKNKNWSYLCFRDRLPVEVRKIDGSWNVFLQSNGVWVASWGRRDFAEEELSKFENVIWKEE